MIRITLFKKQSLLIILLVGSTANPLLALPLKNPSVIKKDVQQLQITQEIKNILINKGLEQESALKKVAKVFKNNKNVESKINRIYTSSTLSLSKDKINDSLVKYALYEKTLDLNSYSGVLGFIQTISLEKMDTQHLSEIKAIANIS